MNLMGSVFSAFEEYLPPKYKEARLAELDQGITDDWFKSHFAYAADVVNTWLSTVIDVKRSRILDFGCGDGIMDLGLAVRHRAKQVVGADLHDSHKYLADTAKTQLGLSKLPRNLNFRVIPPGSPLSSLKPDAIFSWSVFEHVDVSLLPAIFSDLFSALPKGGRFFLQIEPLYYSPFGAHLSGLITQPWVHLLHTEEQLRKIILDTRQEDMADEHKNKTFDVCSFPDFKEFMLREFNSLNKLTIPQLEQLATGAGFEIEKKWTNVLDMDPPEALKAQYPMEDLLTNEIRVLFRRP